MKLPTNGRAKALRSYFGSLIIFLFIIGIIVVFIQFPVLPSNKETVLMLIGAISASIPMIISTITGRDPHDVDALKGTIDKKENQIELLVSEKDRLEKMIIELQTQILENYDNTLDRVLLSKSIDYDLQTNPPKTKK
jgi:low affinity Fe/Cu permease